MTRRLPPKELNVQVAAPEQALRDSMIGEIFAGCPDWMMWAALACLHDFRPDLVKARDVEAERRRDVWLQVHLWKMPRDDVYFARLCRLLKMHGVGSQWGND